MGNRRGAPIGKGVSACVVRARGGGRRALFYTEKKTRLFDATNRYHQINDIQAPKVRTKIPGTMCNVSIGGRNDECHVFQGACPLRVGRQY